MKKWLLDYLADPVNGKNLTLKNAVYTSGDDIESGELVELESGRKYPIINGVPRFIEQEIQRSVDAFGDQWNHFNFDDFFRQWSEQSIANTFGGLNYFKGKTVVDCGAGHGMQSRWMCEAGADRVIALELSHTVDGVMKENLRGLEDKIAVVQCSIDAPPLKKQSIDGLVICHNVIQHTPSVQRTAKELWNLVGKGGEFAFNCYTRDDSSLIQRLRFKVYTAVRWVMQRVPFWVRLIYSHMMALLRFVPGLGWFLEKSMLMARGTVVPGPNWFKRAYRAGVVTTFDGLGGHSFQHHLTLDEQKQMALELQPDQKKWKNTAGYFSRPMPIGIALRIFR